MKPMFLPPVSLFSFRSDLISDSEKIENRNNRDNFIKINFIARFLWTCENKSFAVMAPLIRPPLWYVSTNSIVLFILLFSIQYSFTMYQWHAQKIEFVEQILLVCKISVVHFNHFMVLVCFFLFLIFLVNLSNYLSWSDWFS